MAPVALFLAVVSGGAGHGHYLAAKLLFPVTMASTYLFESITLPFILLAIVQYPVYGLLVGRAQNERKGRWIVWSIGVLHFVALVVVLTVPNPDFA